MPPRIKVAKDAILQTAFDIVRRDGIEAMNARNIASELGCSTQPIFSNFSAMEELRLAVVGKADALCREYIEQEIRSAEFPAYKASGMAYIRFAKEEKELFKLLYMRDRTNETDDGQDSLNDRMYSIVQDNVGVDEMNAKLFHLEMWAFVHGVAVMYATGFLDLDRELVSKMLTDAYQGLCKQYKKE